MKALSVACRRTAMLLLWSMLCIAGPACHGGAKPQSRTWNGYTLPVARPSGDWQPPPEQAERNRLNSIVKQNTGNFQECQWRYAGTTLSQLSVSPSDSGSASEASPLVGKFGVDTSGQVTWLELSPEENGAYGLRECLSERLVKIRFEPPPSRPVMLVFTLPRLKPHRISGLDPSRAPQENRPHL